MVDIVKDLKIERLRVFMQSVSAFFMQIGETLDGIDTPYLNDNSTPIAYDYTGIITITGPMTGSVYVTAHTTMLRDLLQVLGESEKSIELLKDLIGEIANTVSGNARVEFGSDFLISPPTIISGAPPAQYLPKEHRSYIIPFYWRNHKGAIGICIWRR